MNPAVSLVVLAVAAALPASSFAQAIDSSGGAMDLSGGLTFTGVSPSGDIFSDVALGIGLNAAVGIAPPYSVSAPLNSLATISEILAPDLGASVLAILHPASIVGHSLRVESDVDGGFGSRTAVSEARMVIGRLGAFIGTTSIFDLNVATGGEPFLSRAAVEWDGSSLTPLPSSDLLSEANPVTLTVTVLNIPVSVPALSAGSPAAVPVNVSGTAGTAVGTITLTPDVLTTTNDGDFATASAGSLLVDVALDFDVDDFLLGQFTATVTGSFAFNTTHASIRVNPVPEPAGAALLVLSGSLLTARRRRAA